MTDKPSNQKLITAGIMPDILESLVTAITFVSLGMFCVLYFPYLYIGYGHQCWWSWRRFWRRI